MNIQVTKENLFKSLSNVAKVAISTRGSLPILNNVLLKASEGRLNLSATNLEIAISEYVGAKIIEEGQITIPARLFQEYVSSLPSGCVITIKTDEHKVKLDAGEYKSVINGQLADDYPIIPKIEAEAVWKTSSTTLKHALNQVVFAASGDDSRPILTGVLLHSADGHVFMAATDSYRLAEKDLGTTKASLEMLVPASAMADLQRILKDEEDVFVHTDGQQVAFRMGDIEIISRLIEGVYPAYKKLLPSSFSDKAQLDRAEMQNAVKLASLFARENAGSIKLSTRPDSNALVVETSTSQLGENSTNLDSQVEGDGAEISLNSRYILDGLQAIGGSSVAVKMNGKLDPCIFEGIEDQTYTYLIMPLKS